MFVGSFDELAVDEGRAGTDEGAEMRGDTTRQRSLVG
jgi:hypothetical protein